ncbi:trans-resveratrol di-O-methyltransferase-like [Vitis riparia]|uniref:trans-resveratrol di-O-methyltransferase-like n=1 Tax=Vitis riparia TaxID=96939 RepID=UPI00155B37E0|nr:trans-resveratrol di-O-methyltransferase-like [Vitis riparia]
MALAVGETSTELLHAHAHVWNHIFNFINSMSLKCAIELGIPDIIHNHGKPMTLSELVAELPVNPEKTKCVYRLMRLLVQSGFFSRKRVQESGQEEGYVLTLASRLLLKDDPLSARPFLLAMLDPVLITPWQYVSAWFQNDDPTPFDTAHGRTFWDYAGHEPKLNNFFNEAMASDARLVTSVLIKDCKGIFVGLNSLVDVGGGTGTVARAIANAFPHLNCTVLDLPHVVAGLEGSKNLNYLAGDMFEAIPPADAILLKWILHDWNHDECVKILKRCRDVIPSKEKGGKVIIIDMMMENQKADDESIETQLFWDMLMMIVLTGQERNIKDWEKLFFDAGFSGYKITPMLGLRSLIEVYP